MSVHNQSRRRTAAKPRRIGKALRATSFAMAGGLSSVIALSLGAAQAQGLPQQGEIVTGSGAISYPDALTSQISQTSDRLVIYWNSFDIGRDKRVHFNQPGAQSIALNRVIGSQGSQILGQLTANGQVFLVNPNGVLFGRGARVDVGGLVASTLPLDTNAFMQGATRHVFSGRLNQTPAPVVNQGALKAADGGYVALFGGQVDNQGIIRADLGMVALVAGGGVTLDVTGNGVLNVYLDRVESNMSVSNSNLLRARGGQVVLKAGSEFQANSLRTVVNNQGLIEAQTFQNRAGRILLDGGLNGMVVAAGTLDASAPVGDAGRIDVQGRAVTLAGTMLARASGAGQGGQVSFLGDELRHLAKSRVDTRSASGKTGTLNLAAAQFVVTRDDITAENEIGAGAVNELLASNNVALTATRGDLRVDGGIDWNTGHALSLTAADNIKLNADVRAVGRGAALALEHGTDKDYSLARGVKVTLSGEQAGFALNGKQYVVIQDVHQLQAMEQDVAGLYVLGNDIDASDTRSWNAGAGFRPVAGTDPTRRDKVFSGVLSGLGNEVRNLYVRNPESRQPGIYGYFGGLFNTSVGTLRNINLTALSFHSGAEVAGGGVIGHNAGVIKQVHVYGQVSGDAAEAVGGLAAVNTGSIDASSFDGQGWTSQLSASRVGRLGGLAGINIGRISRSFASGKMAGGSTQTGGLVGANYEEGTIVDSMAKAIVQSTFQAGGAVGENLGRIQNVHVLTGSLVTGANATGGLVGQNSGSIKNSTAAASVLSGQPLDSAGGLVGNNKGGLISYSHASGSVRAESFETRVGGLVGSNHGGTIAYSSASGDVYAGLHHPGYIYHSPLAGGLVGSHENAYVYDYATGRSEVRQAVITDSRASGNVYRQNAAAIVGGLVGVNSALIVNSNAFGHVIGKGGDRQGVLVGENRYIDRQQWADERPYIKEDISHLVFSTIRQSAGYGQIDGMPGPQVGINNGIVE